MDVIMIQNQNNHTIPVTRTYLGSVLTGESYFLCSIFAIGHRSGHLNKLINQTSQVLCILEYHFLLLYKLSATIFLTFHFHCNEWVREWVNGTNQFRPIHSSQKVIWLVGFSNNYKYEPITDRLTILTVLP